MCTVAGVLSAGADCTTINSKQHTGMTLEGYIEFLEPDMDAKKAGAVCESFDDFMADKKAIETACALLGDARCTLEIKKKIKDIENEIKELVHAN